MAQEKSIQFLQNKLTVEVENKIIASCVDWDNYLTQSARIGGAKLRIKESKKWDGYKGGFNISEWEFFKTAGLHKQANASKSYHSTTSFLNWGGFGVTIVGLALCAIGSKWFTKTAEEWDTTESILCYSGFGGFCVGITMGIVAYSRPKKIFPVSFAIEVADDYNKRLKKYLE